MKLWNPLASTYNKIPLVKKINPDLEEYISNEAMNGLFTLIAAEEKKIRQDPAARVTDLLKKLSVREVQEEEFQMVPGGTQLFSNVNRKQDLGRLF